MPPKLGNCLDRYALKKRRRLNYLSSSSPPITGCSSVNPPPPPMTTPTIKQYSRGKRRMEAEVRSIQMGGGGAGIQDKIDLELEVKIEEVEAVRPDIDHFADVESEFPSQLVTMPYPDSTLEVEVEEPIPFSGLDVDPLEQEGNVDVGVDPESEWNFGIISKVVSMSQDQDEETIPEPSLKGGRLIPDTETVCHHCGTLSRILDRCEYCGIDLSKDTRKLVASSRSQPQPAKRSEPGVSAQGTQYLRDDPRLRCSHCGKDMTSFTRYGRVRHQQNCKPRPPPLKCKFCGVIIKSGNPLYLRRHEEKFCWGLGSRLKQDPEFQVAQIDYGRLNN